MVVVLPDEININVQHFVTFPLTSYVWHDATIQKKTISKDPSNLSHDVLVLFRSLHII